MAAVLLSYAVRNARSTFCGLCNEHVSTFSVLERPCSLLLQILATPTVSAAEPERMFSKVDLTLTEIRSTTCEDRLEAVVLMQAASDRLVS